MNDRLQRLEEKIAYLERHVTEQDKAMLEMADEIAGLRRELRALREHGPRDAGGTQAGAAEDLPHERPPHY
ncbi:MAG: SlyX family protein [Opitutaceae bacterium]|nr:SlyX family protein [Opitutaceae bacterium]